MTGIDTDIDLTNTATARVTAFVPLKRYDKRHTFMR